MPVRIGTPSGIKGIIDEIQDSSYATSVGLLIYGARTEGQFESTPFGFGTLPSLSFGKFSKRIINLIKSFIP